MDTEESARLPYTQDSSFLLNGVLVTEPVLRISELTIGTWIRIDCEDVSSYEKGRRKIFIGEIISLFDAIGGDAGEDWAIELRNREGHWWMYKSKIDGGTISLIKDYKPKPHNPRFAF